MGGLHPNVRVYKNGPTRRIAAIKQKMSRCGFVYPILKCSGALEKSLTESNASNSINIINKTNMIIGTSISYGIYHQSDLPRKKLPLRKFLFIGPEAPRFATSDQMGRPERWLNYINDFVLAKVGLIGTVRGQKVKP